MNILSNIWSKEEIVEIVIFVKWKLYNQMVPSGAKAIRGNMESLDVEPLPSVSTINRILKDNYYTHRRMGTSPEDYRKDSPEYNKKYLTKKRGSNTFLKLERPYRANGEAKI